MKRSDAKLIAEMQPYEKANWFILLKNILKLIEEIAQLPWPIHFFLDLPFQSPFYLLFSFNANLFS